MALYRKALELDPTNFLVASELAQSYYGMKPPKTGTEEGDRKAAQQFHQEALDAWKKALALARDDIERQGVLIHFARIQINAGRYDEARKNLDSVTNDMFSTTKRNLAKKLESKLKK
jgi:tetratricopeptide (TPR) repeat protein